MAASEWMDSRPDDGVRWLLVRSGTRRIDRAAAARGRFQWTGDYWQTTTWWGPVETARYFTTTDRETLGDPPGTEWVQVFVNVDPAGA